MTHASLKFKEKCSRFSLISSALSERSAALAQYGVAMGILLHFTPIGNKIYSLALTVTYSQEAKRNQVVLTATQNR